MKVDSIEDSQKASEEAAGWSSSRFLALGFILILAGIIVIGIAALISVSGSSSYGIVIFIGPFPIALGGGPNASWLILIGIILAVLSVVLFINMNRRTKTNGD